MEQITFTLLHVKEIPFKMNLDINEINDDIKKQLGIGFLFVIQYQKNNKASALHAIVRLSLNDSIILEGGATMIFESKVWDDMNHDEGTVQKSNFAKQIVDYALPFINGIMMTRIQNTKLKGLFIPIIDTSELVKNIKVEELPAL